MLRREMLAFAIGSILVATTQGAPAPTKDAKKDEVRAGEWLQEWNGRSFLMTLDKDGTYSAKASDDERDAWAGSWAWSQKRGF